MCASGGGAALCPGSSGRHSGAGGSVEHHAAAEAGELRGPMHQALLGHSRRRLAPRWRRAHLLRAAGAPSAPATASSGATATATASTTATSSAAMLQRRVDKVLSAPVDSADVLTALETLSEFYTENTRETRRSLQGEIEKKGLLQMATLLESFRPVANHLEQVKSCVSSLEQNCSDLHQRILSAKQGTAHLVSRTKELEAERLELEEQEQNVNNFLEYYYLSAEEEKILQDQVIGKPFFDALDHIHVFRERCKDLLQNYHQRAGLDIMDSLSQKLEMGLETLCKWCLDVVRKLTDAQPEVPAHLTRSLQLLRFRPAYFKQCICELRSCRRSVLLERFLNALQIGGPDGMPRPIEIHAHDSLRYTSDMLAYVHQALATEREVAVLLYSSASEAEGSFSGARSTLSHDESALVAQHLVEVIEGARKPLEARIQQALESEHDTVVTYQLSSVLRFYHDTFAGVVSADASLCTALAHVTSAANAQFMELVASAGERLLQHVPAAPADLCAPRALTDALQHASRILHACDAAVAASAASVAPVLAATLDPLLQLCSLSAADLDLSDHAIYHINTITAIQNELRGYDFAQMRMETLSLQLSTYMETLVSEQATKLLRRSGVSEKLELLQQHRQSGETALISSIDGMDAFSMSETMRSFYQSVFALGSLVLPQCDKLMLPQLRSEVRDGVAGQVAAAYSTLYEAINDPKSGYDDPHLILQHSPDQVSTLLDG